MKDRLRLPALLLVTAALLAGCPEGECEPGFQRDDTGTCLPLAPEACAEGSLAILGEEACVPIGWSACGEAFAPEDGGCTDACPEGEDDSDACRAAGVLPCPDGFVAADYGCEAVFPSEPCEGATRRALGSTSCVPLGACAAPFPPADATLFVDASLEGEALDDTHFATLGEALAAAKRGDVIAVEAGRYREPISIPTGVSVVGRCAAEVILEGPGSPGVKARAATDVRLSGVTIRGFDIGMEIERGAEALVEDVLIEGNQTVGIFVLDARTTLTLRRSEVRDTRPDGGQYGSGIAVGFGATLRLEESTITGSHDMGIQLSGEGSAAHIEQSAVLHTSGRGDGTFGMGLYLPEGTRAVVHESFFRDHQTAALNAVGAGSTLEVRGSVIESTRMGGPAPGMEIGLGINAQLGASLLVEDVTLRDHGAYALRVGETEHEAIVSGLVVDGVRPLEELDVSAGVAVERGASMTLSRSFVRNPELLYGSYPVGVILLRGARAALEDVTVSETGAIGIIANGEDTSLTLARVLVRDIAGWDPSFGYGLSASDGASVEARDSAFVRTSSTALFIEQARARFERIEVRDSIASGRGRGRGASVQYEAEAHFHRCRISGSTQVGLFAFGRGARIELEESAVTETALTPGGEHGHAVEAIDNATIVVKRSRLADNAGVGAIFAGGGGVLEDTVVANNRVGIHTFEGSTLQELSEAPAKLDASDVVVVRSAFIGNETRVGSGVLPLPEPATRTVSSPDP